MRRFRPFARRSSSSRGPVADAQTLSKAALAGNAIKFHLLRGDKIHLLRGDKMSEPAGAGTTNDPWRLQTPPLTAAFTITATFAMDEMFWFAQ